MKEYFQLVAFCIALVLIVGIMTETSKCLYFGKGDKCIFSFML